jgi:hypothetical protein
MFGSGGPAVLQWFGFFLVFVFILDGGVRFKNFPS